MRKPNLNPNKGELLTRNQMKNVSGGANSTEICMIALCTGTDQTGNSFDGLCSQDCYCVSPEGYASPQGCGKWS